MSPIAQSIFVFSFYLLGSGLALFFAPNFVISLVGLESTSEPWIHIVGILTFILGVFFFYMGKKGSRDFAYISLYGRGSFIVGVAVIVLAFGAPWQLLLFAGIDVLGLGWTLYALRN